MKGKRLVERSRRRWEDNIKEIVLEGVKWIRVAHCIVQWLAVVNVVM
jgi:hypothetical protein